MSKYSEKSNYANSIRYANKGLRAAVKSQKNFRFQLLISVLVIIFAFFLKFNKIEFCITVFAIGLVLVAELINSAIEFSLDAYFHNKKNTLVGLAKDMSAGAVLIATITAVIIGSILFLNHLYDLLITGYYWHM